MAARATQFLVPDGVGLDAALDRLAARLRLAAAPAQPTEQTYYDTFDGRLHAAGLALSGERGRLVAVSVPDGEELATGPDDQADRRFTSALPAGPLRDLLDPIVGVRALEPIVRMRGARRAVRVLNGDEKTVVRLVLEAAAGLAEAGPLALRPRVYIRGVRGYDRALARVGRTLSRDLGFEATDVALHHEAMRATGRTPGGVSTKLELSLMADEPATQGAASALAAMLRTIELTLPGVLGDVDTEFLHDFRVAVRRTRSVQRQLAGALPPERLPGFRSEFRWLGQVTGPTRDLDVLLLDFARVRAELTPQRAGELDPLGLLLRRRRDVERRRMVAALESPRTRALLADWSAFLAGLRAAHGRGRSERRLPDLVGQRIRAVYRQMRRAGLEIDDATPPERLHDLRKRGKELRYLLEIFAGLYPPDAVQPTLKALKALQETLGRFQDREVQATTLRSLGAELASVEGGPAALMALGVVLPRIEADSAAARAEFAECFAAFAAPRQRAVVRQAFR